MIQRDTFLSCCLLLLLLIPATIEAQSGQTFYDMASLSQSYYPVSAEAAALFRHTQNEVDYARGRANIRIPLYTIRTSSFTLPITLCYTTGGIKVDQKSGVVGLGWTLEAEPMVTREIRGLRDEQYYMRDKSYMEDYPILFYAQVMLGEKDNLADFFHFRTLNSSGKFRVKMADSGVFDPDLLNREYVKLETNSATVSDMFANEIRLTDCSGTVYRYGSSFNAREITRANETAVTCWKASSITSVNGENINFTYEEYPNGEVHTTAYDYYATVGHYINSQYNVYGYWKGVDGLRQYYIYQNGTWTPSGNSEPYVPPIGRLIDTRPISRITFAEGRIDFTYDDTTKSLASISVRNPEGRLIKQIVFNRTTITPIAGHSRYLLSDVVVKDGVSANQEKYTFTYIMPSTHYTPFTKAVDYWGYYNGETGNTDLIERQTVDAGAGRTIALGGAVRDANPLYAAYYSLASVKYPTGGVTSSAIFLMSLYFIEKFSSDGCVRNNPPIPIILQGPSADV